MDLRYTIFGCIGQSLRVWARNIVSMFVLGLIFFSPLILYTVSEVLEVRAQGGLSETRGTLWVVIMMFLTYAADQFLAAPIVYSVVQELNGTHASVGACVWQGLKRFFPVVFTVFLVYWCVVFGLNCFIIPAFVLAPGLYVAVPAAVCERPGAMGTLTRSFSLTEGNRLRIFVLMCLFWGLRITAIVMVMSWLNPDGDAGKIQALLISVLAINFLFGMIGGVMQGVTYSRLRQIKDGVSTDDLAKIFE